MKMNIEVETFDKQLNKNMFGKKSVDSGDKIEIFRNTTLFYQLTLKKFSIEEPDTIIFTLDIKGNLATNASIFATWLFDNLNNRVLRLKINQKEVAINGGEIKKIMQQIIQ